MSPYRQNAMHRSANRSYAPSIVAVLLTAIVLAFDGGCSFFQSPQGAAVVTAGVDLAVCVLNHSQEPVQQIVTDCGASTAADVIKILDAHKAAMLREAK